MNKELEQVEKEINDEYSAYIKDEKWNNQIMMNSFIFDKLAQFEIRLRNIENGKNRADAYLSLHTPLM
jgi:hypothetical protein